MSLDRNARSLLNALVLADDGDERGGDWDREQGLQREQLAKVLPDAERLEPLKLVKNAITDFRHQVGIPILPRADPVKLPRDGSVSVDLWEFLDLVEARHFGKAGKLVASSRIHLEMPEGFTEHHEFWRRTVERFERAKEQLLRAEAATAGQLQKMSDMRAHLLKRSLLPWGEGPPIEEVRAAIEAIEYPWHLLVPSAQKPDGTPQDYMAGLFATEPTGDPTRLVVLGGHGSGKTLASVGVFLRLTDWLEDPGAGDGEMRPVLYVDGRDERHEPGFAGDAWLEERVGEPDPDPRRRPVVIMAHADSYLATASPRQVLGSRLFGKCDVLLCCGERFYESQIKYRNYATHVVRLGPWGKPIQSSYAEALFPGRGREDLEAWRDARGSDLRADVCEVPLHLTLLLPRLQLGSPDRAQIEVDSWLLEQLARERIGSGLPGPVSVDDWMAELAAVAHRFYQEPTSTESLVAFHLDDLRAFLQPRSSASVKARVEAIVGDTLILGNARTGIYHFERPVWGSFFAARHLAGVVRLGDPETSVLDAFGKSHSVRVVELCEEILRDRMYSDGDRIIAALRFALLEEENEMRPHQLVIAREQLGYLLAAVGDEEIREELVALVAEAGSAVSDPIVQSAIARGLEREGSSPPLAVLAHRDGA